MQMIPPSGEFDFHPYVWPIRVHGEDEEGEQLEDTVRALWLTAYGDYSYRSARSALCDRCLVFKEHVCDRCSGKFICSKNVVKETWVHNQNHTYPTLRGYKECKHWSGGCEACFRGGECCACAMPVATRSWLGGTDCVGSCWTLCNDTQECWHVLCRSCSIHIEHGCKNRDILGRTSKLREARRRRMSFIARNIGINIEPPRRMGDRETGLPYLCFVDCNKCSSPSG